MFISVSAILVGVQGVDRLLHPQPLGAQALGIAVILGSLVATGLLLLFQRHVVRVTGSTAIRADSLHYRSDILLNSSILIALVVANFGFGRLDALFGIAISGYILWSALQIGRESVSVLMDEELSEDLRQRIEELALTVPQVLDVHDLRTRVSGTHWFIQLHVSLPGGMSLIEAHDHAEAVEAAIRKEYPRAEVLVHTDPLEVLKARAE